MDKEALKALAATLSLSDCEGRPAHSQRLQIDHEASQALSEDISYTDGYWDPQFDSRWKIDGDNPCRGALTGGLSRLDLDQTEVPYNWSLVLNTLG